jgi:hypothetical protein
MRLHLVRALVLVVASLGLAACGGGGGGGGGGKDKTPASITIVGGNGQTAVAGTTLPAALSVSVKDGSGRPVGGTTVTWAVIAGGGSVTPASSTTDSAGLATTQWTLGGTLGANGVTATAGTLPAVAFDATGVAGPAASVSIVSGNGQSGSVGTELPAALTVRVTDAGSRPVGGTTVTWAVVAGGGSVTPTSATTDSSGAAITRWTLGTTPGANRVTATVAGISVVAFEATATTAVTASVTVTSPVEKIYEGDTVQLTAVAKDAYGNVLPGKSATWSSGNPKSFPLSASGELNTWGTGAVTVTASVDGITGSLALTVVPIEVQVTLGAKEVVFDWSNDRCEDLDVPDGPAIFVRAEDGSLTLFDGNAPRYFVSRGADFNSMRRDCTQPALVSAERTTPESYENREWLWAVFREGSTWHALVHNEFHDLQSPGCQPGDQSPSDPCWYNSITYAVSTDRARTFSKPGAPAHTVAPAPNAWVPPRVPADGFVEGYFTPSNIVRGKDGYYYSFLMVIPAKNGPQGRCVFRTSVLGDPSTWRAWDGNAFNLRMSSPYVTGEAVPVCALLATSLFQGQVIYSSYLDRYVYVAATGTGYEGRSACGFFYELSADLIHWSQHRQLTEANLPWCSADPSQSSIEPVTVLYPSLIDHADTTVNFETMGRTPHLYYSRFNENGLDRDLVRVPVTFTRTN